MEQEKSLQDMSMQAFFGELPDLSKATPAPLPHQRRILVAVEHRRKQAYVL